MRQGVRRALERLTIFAGLAAVTLLAVPAGLLMALAAGVWHLTDVLAGKIMRS